MHPALELELTPEVLASLSNNRSVNRAHLEGLVGSSPMTRRLSKKTSATTFLLVTSESWVTREGVARHHPNTVLIEVLGKDSERVSHFRVGDWASVDGYLRMEGSAVRIRTYSVKAFDPEAESGGPCTKRNRV